MEQQLNSSTGGWIGDDRRDEADFISVSQNIAKPLVSSGGFVSGCCEGEKCSVCGKPATNKLEETIFQDDPYPMRHPLTAYVCKEHFRMIVGSLG